MVEAGMCVWGWVVACARARVHVHGCAHQESHLQRRWKCRTAALALRTPVCKQRICAHNPVHHQTHTHTTTHTHTHTHTYTHTHTHTHTHTRTHTLSPTRLAPMPAPGLRREDRDKQAVADRVDQRLDTRCCRASDHRQRLVEPRQRTCHEQRSSRHGPPRCLAPARAPAQQRRRGAAGRRKGGGSKMAATSRASAGRGAVHSAQRKGQKGERRCLVGSRKARAPPAEGAGGAWSIVGQAWRLACVATA